MAKQRVSDFLLFSIAAALLLGVAFLLTPRWGGRLLFLPTFTLGFVAASMAINVALGGRLAGIAMVVASVTSFLFLPPTWGGWLLRWIVLIPMGVLGVFVALPEFKASAERRDVCRQCKKELFLETAARSMQAMFLSRGNVALAMTAEQSIGFVCTHCAERFCMACLERSPAGHDAGGRSCPRCGGSTRPL